MVRKIGCFGLLYLYQYITFNEKQTKNTNKKTKQPILHKLFQKTERRNTTQFVYLIIITFIPKLDSNIIRRNIQTNLSHEYRRERSWTKFYTLNHTKRNLSNITRALWQLQNIHRMQSTVQGIHSIKKKKKRLLRAIPQEAEAKKETWY